MILNDAKSVLHEALKISRDKGEAESSKEYKMEMSVWKQQKKAMESRVKKFLLFTNKAIKLSPDKPDSDLNWVNAFVESEGQKMAAYEAEQSRLRRPTVFAKKFLPRMEFIRMVQANPEEARTYDPKTCTTEKYCTFTNNDILSFMATKLVMMAEEVIKTGLKNAEEYGFKRDRNSGLTPPSNGKTKAPGELSPPRATPSQARGASKAPAAAAKTSDDPIDVSINLPPVYKNGSHR
jgi:hypothetical protein